MNKKNKNEFASMFNQIVVIFGTEKKFIHPFSVCFYNIQKEKKTSPHHTTGILFIEINNRIVMMKEAHLEAVAFWARWHLAKKVGVG